MAALAVALLIVDQLGSSKYVISHAVEAVYGGPHLFVTGTSTAADNKLYEEALAAGRVTSLDEWYRAKLLAYYVESGQCPDAATSEWCAKKCARRETSLKNNNGITISPVACFGCFWRLFRLFRP